MTWVRALLPSAIAGQRQFAARQTGVEMDQRIRSVCIVGGGSAGWLTAGLIAAQRGGTGPEALQITLVESEQLGILGVGEGTWPTMRNTLKKIGISETAFIRHCNASFKQGAKFAKWRTGSEDDFYYHPLVLPEGFPALDLAPYWNAASAAGEDELSFSDRVCFQEYICERDLAPKLITSPEFGGVANYAYHLDAYRFAEMLRNHCVEHLGVRHIIDDVIDVRLAENGDIAAIINQRSGPLEADIFVDCTGFAARLLGQALEVPFIDCNDVLFIDRAMAVQVPYESEDSPIVSHTVSTGQKHGWIWDIGLQNRRGVGYVYSSGHAGVDDVEAELAAYVGPQFKDLKTREIKIRSGHRAQFWKNNCVAVGVAAGFLEPLEASALVMIELSADFLANSLPATKGTIPIVAQRYNEMTRYRWDRVIDFLKLHYVLTNRTDTSFWRDNCDPDTIPQRLRDQLELWRYNSPGEHDFASSHEMFPAASYQYVLLGMGFQMDIAAQAHARRDPRTAQEAFQRNAMLKQKWGNALPTNRDLLNKLAHYEFQKI